MNLTDRIYLAVHLLLTLLMCVRHQSVPHWPVYVVWNMCAVAAILLLADKRSDGQVWEFVHDWIPLVFFTITFEEISLLSLAIRGEWQNDHLIALESWLFSVSPMQWMHARAHQWLIEFMEFGYFCFYPLYPGLGGWFWGFRRRPQYRGAFRRMTDTLSMGYVICYVIYLLFPTQSPANRAGVQQIGSPQAGIFQHLVRGIQNHAGVHGNAFPSAHIMLTFVVLMFAYRFLPRVAPWLLIPMVLMCVGAVYDGYHYTSDVVVGALIGVVLGAVFSRAKENPPATGRVPRDETVRSKLW